MLKYSPVEREGRENWRVDARYDDDDDDGDNYDDDVDYDDTQTGILWLEKF